MPVLPCLYFPVKSMSVPLYPPEIYTHARNFTLSCHKCLSFSITSSLVWIFLLRFQTKSEEK